MPRHVAVRPTTTRGLARWRYRQRRQESRTRSECRISGRERTAPSRHAVIAVVPGDGFAEFTTEREFDRVACASSRENAGRALPWP